MFQIIDENYFFNKLQILTYQDRYWQWSPSWGDFLLNLNSLFFTFSWSLSHHWKLCCLSYLLGWPHRRLWAPFILFAFLIVEGKCSMSGSVSSELLRSLHMCHGLWWIISFWVVCSKTFICLMFLKFVISLLACLMLWNYLDLRLFRFLSFLVYSAF